jgi:hypothetical protein
VKLGEKNAKMASSFNDLLHKGFLFQEVRLEFEETFATASDRTVCGYLQHLSILLLLFGII